MTESGFGQATVEPRRVSEPGPDLAECFVVWTRGFRSRHERLFKVVGGLLRAGLILGIPIVILALIFVPSLFKSVPVVVGMLWFLVQLAFLARSRTLPFMTVWRFCSLGAMCAMPIGLTEVLARNLIGWKAYDNEPSVFIAGPFEEALKLLPLLLFGLVATNRMRRMGAADFLLAAGAAGAGFQLVEDTIRQVATQPGLLAVFDPNKGQPVYGPLTLFPGWMASDKVEFAGHGVTTAIIGAGIGLAVVHRGRRGWRWLLPFVLLAWMTLGHAAFNDTVTLGSASLPGWATSIYLALGSGHVERHLLLLLLVAVMVVDYRAIDRVEPEALPLPRTATPTPPARFVEELRLYFRALRTGPGALVAAGQVTRAQRELAIGIYRSARRPGRLSKLRSLTYDRSSQLAQILAAAGVLSLAIGMTVAFSGNHMASLVFLAGLFAALGRWWDNLSAAEKALLILTLLEIFGLALGPEAIAFLAMRSLARMILRAGLNGRLGKAAYAAARYLSRFADRSLGFPLKQLQSKWKHAKDFGVTASWNKAAAATFQKALEAHVHNPNTLVIKGTYRGNPVTHFFNPKTGLNVMRGPNGEFISGWRLDPNQIRHMLRDGKLT